MVRVHDLAGLYVLFRALQLEAFNLPVTWRICLNKPPLQAAFYGVFRNKFEQKIRQNLEQNFLAAPIRSKPAPSKGSA
tara:strand:- start:46 stop:279 length:234 start_codon:yes stop_codon:yes gene_type:complete